MKNWLDPGIGSTADTILRKVPIATRQYVRSGELAKITGVSTDTLRHHEHMGLLAVVTGNIQSKPRIGFGWCGGPWLSSPPCDDS